MTADRPDLRRSPARLVHTSALTRAFAAVWCALAGGALPGLAAGVLLDRSWWLDLVALGLLLAGLGGGAAWGLRVGVLESPEGLLVRDLLGSRFLAWHEVRGVTTVWSLFGRGMLPGGPGLPCVGLLLVGRETPLPLNAMTCWHAWNSATRPSRSARWLRQVAVRWQHEHDLPGDLPWSAPTTDEWPRDRRFGR